MPLLCNGELTPLGGIAWGGKTEGGWMKVSVKDKKVSDAHTSVVNPRKKDTAAVCEICGQLLERDPESGEYVCPACYYEENPE